MSQDQSDPVLQSFIKKFGVPEKLHKIIPKILSEHETVLLSYLADKKVRAREVFLRFTDLPATILVSCFEKGYLFRQVIDGKKFYSSCSLEGILKRFIIHSSEFSQLSLNDLSVIQECVMERAKKEMQESEKPVYRVLPVEVAIEDKRQLIPYHQARNYVQASPKIAVVQCLCRSTFQNCCRPLEVCLSLNDKAEFFISRNIGKEISVQRALEVLDTAQEHDLVHAINNVETPEYLCNCCECCCVFVQGLKKLGIATSMGRSGFTARINTELCDRCGLCAEKCLFGAISFQEEEIAIWKDHCFGCGLCSYHCSRSAVQLIMLE
ncbi:MAG: hypothetical protein GF421_10740 [Candidatus Aminicenantes bacterium]|nr:hypothetical protein [Candidatus Aminicenantes bacterium]